MPITADLEVRGTVVDNYFDNLLPDSPAIRRRIRERFGTRSTDAFNLLEAIGRDCVGAVQLLPVHQEPINWNRVEATRLNDAEMEELLQAVPSSPPRGPHEGGHGHEHDDQQQHRGDDDQLGNGLAIVPMDPTCPATHWSGTSGSVHCWWPTR